MAIIATGTHNVSPESVKVYIKVYEYFVTLEIQFSAENATIEHTLFVDHSERGLDGTVTYLKGKFPEAEVLSYEPVLGADLTINQPRRKA